MSEVEELKKKIAEMETTESYLTKICVALVRRFGGNKGVIIPIVEWKAASDEAIVDINVNKKGKGMVVEVRDA